MSMQMERIKSQTHKQHRGSEPFCLSWGHSSPPGFLGHGSHFPLPTFCIVGFISKPFFLSLFKWGILPIRSAEVDWCSWAPRWRLAGWWCGFGGCGTVRCWGCDRKSNSSFHSHQVHAELPDCFMLLYLWGHKNYSYFMKTYFVLDNHFIYI